MVSRNKPPAKIQKTIIRPLKSSYSPPKPPTPTFAQKSTSLPFSLSSIQKSPSLNANLQTYKQNLSTKSPEPAKLDLEKNKTIKPPVPQKSMKPPPAQFPKRKFVPTEY